MGEAKQRKSMDPLFGMKPKTGRGIMLSAPVRFDGESCSVRNDINPAELRRAILFCDKIVWPNSKIVRVLSNPDEQLLEKEGILIRPRPDHFSSALGIGNTSSLIVISEGSRVEIDGATARYFVQEHIEEFLSLDRKEPGQWVLSEGEGSFYLKNKNFVAGRGQRVTLSRAIPLPAYDYPIEELLEFKKKREAEITALNYELDRFYSNIKRSKDQEFELNRLVSVVDKHCADMIRVASESKWRFHLGDLIISLSFNNLDSARNRAIGWEAGILATTGLPIVGAVLGVGASVLSIERGIGARKLSQRGSPFRVVSAMHKELIR